MNKNTAPTPLLKVRPGVKNTMKNAIRKSVTLWLPFPLSTNQLWRYGKGRAYISNAYKDWIDSADNAYLQQKRGLPKEPIEGKFAASIILDLSKFGNQDIDNTKCVLDFLQRVRVITNDKNCFSYTITWGNADGGTTISIIEIPDA